MEHAYQSLQDAFFVQNGQLVGGDGTLNQLEFLPFHWPLAKLTLPLKFGVNRLEGLVVGFLMELMATKSQPWRCRRQISSFAKTLTVRVATYLAKEIASLFRPVLQHPVMALTDDDTLSLLTSDFWIRPVYEELRRPAHSLFFFARCCLGKIPGGAPIQATNSRQQQIPTKRGGREDETDARAVRRPALAGHLLLTCFQIPFQTLSSCSLWGGSIVSVASGYLRVV